VEAVETTAPKANDLRTPTTRLCLALEEHRRTAAGRVRTPEEFLAAFFPHDASKSEDRVFRYMPREVRGPVLAAWGIRGAKAAARDDDEKVRSVVHDALIAGDLDASAFEEGLMPEVIVHWIALPSLWSFWRAGKQSKAPIEKALMTGYELGLFDAKWLLDTIESGGGKVRGTDVLAEGLSKADLTAWLKRVQESGDGTPKGLVAALGWETIVARTSNEVLLAVMDALAAKVGLTSKAAAPSALAGLTTSAATAVATAAPVAASDESELEPVPQSEEWGKHGEPTKPPPVDAEGSTDVEMDDSSATEIFTTPTKGSVRPEPAVPPSARPRQKVR
jgi:hypothetical protein